MRRLGQYLGRKFLSTRGQTFILVMTVTALATVLGIIAMSAALMSVRIRSMHRLADKNFYHLELALEEVRAGAELDADLQLRGDGKESAAWLGEYLRKIGIMDPVVLSADSAVRMSSRREAAILGAGDYLAGFSLTIPVKGASRTVEDRTEELTVEVGDLSLNAEGGITYSDVTFTLINYERDAQTQIVCDLIVIPPDSQRETDGAVRIDNWRRIG